MINSPLENSAVFLGGSWLQKRPYITQPFGANPNVYKQFGHDGHNGADFRAKVGTSVFSPIEGVVKVVRNQGGSGYGKYIEIHKSNLKVVLAHLSEFNVRVGDKVYLGDKVALTGNTGFSSGPHLHMTVKRMEGGKVVDRGNGYNGAIDFAGFCVTYKGTLNKTTINE